MNNKFKKINELKDSFEFNLDDVSSSKFETTRSLFSDFTSAFNVKALAIAAMMGLSTGAIAAEPVPLSAIQESFNKSLTIVNTNYNENLPTYFDVKDNIKDDITLKNEFWPGGVVTLVEGEVNDPIDISNHKYRKQISLINETKGEAVYISQFTENALAKTTPDLYFSTQSEYKHYFRNHSESTDIMKTMFRPENQQYVDDFITYHEMAHASFEQESSKVDPLNPIKVQLSIAAEAHSDVSAIFMVGKKNGLSYERFREFALDLSEKRSYFAATTGDAMHNSSVIITELIHTLDKNKSIYTNMTNDKISAFSAYVVNNVINQDVKPLISNLESIGVTTKISGFLEKFDEFRSELKRINDTNSDVLRTPIMMQGAGFYINILESVYFEKHLDKFEEYNRAIANKDVSKAVDMKLAMYDEIRDQDKTEKAIYAVSAAKLMSELDFAGYSQVLSSYCDSKKIIVAHDTSSLSGVFKDNKKELNQIISAERTLKQQL